MKITFSHDEYYGVSRHTYKLIVHKCENDLSRGRAACVDIYYFSSNAICFSLRVTFGGPKGWKRVNLREMPDGWRVGVLGLI